MSDFPQTLDQYLACDVDSCVAKQFESELSDELAHEITRLAIDKYRKSVRKNARAKWLQRVAAILLVGGGISWGMHESSPEVLVSNAKLRTIAENEDEEALFALGKRLEDSGMQVPPELKPIEVIELVEEEYEVVVDSGGIGGLLVPEPSGCHLVLMSFLVLLIQRRR